MEPLAKGEFKNVNIKVPWGHVAGRWYGNRQLRPILAIHGWLDNIGTWERLIPLMPQHIGVLCIDLPGHGHSSHLPRGISYYVIDFVRIIGRVMQEYKWQKVSLMGHSLGSIICFIYTALFPQNVDLLVAIDLIIPLKRSLPYAIRSYEQSINRMLIEDQKLESMGHQDPPAYSYDQLERMMYDGSYQSVALENCKYILDRNITKSSNNEDKYSFVRDSRLKNYVQFRPSHELLLKMVRNIVNMPYFLIKGSESTYMNEDTIEALEILSQQNPYFEFHELEGTHHVHLNNPNELAAILNPFIRRHRPSRTETSSLAQDAACSESDSIETEQPKLNCKPCSKL